MFKVTLLAALSLMLMACDSSSSNTHLQDSNSAVGVQASSTEQLTVYKSPTCGCCGKWLDHLAQSGVPNVGQNSDSMSAIKAELGIQPQYQSCHTGVSKDGYVFEGHVPAKYIKQFLENPPENALGLSVPAMPLGSPGMEVPDGNGGTKFMPYKVILLMKGGDAKVFADVPSYASQF